jgi:ribose 5-phosphate isomerase B
MRIAIGSDHAGFALKETLGRWLGEQGHDVIDCGTHSAERADYPQFGQAVGLAVTGGDADFGVAVCGSGQGICMAANKIAGVRAGVVRDIEDATMIRRHNDANVACFGERFTTPEIALDALQVFLDTPFDGGRHAGRVEKLAGLDVDHGLPDGSGNPAV